MTTEEMISKAFFKGYGITFNTLKVKEDVYESRVLHTISDLNTTTMMKCWLVVVLIWMETIDNSLLMLCRKSKSISI